jgi:hypothetical protein
LLRKKISIMSEYQLFTLVFPLKKYFNFSIEDCGLTNK